MSAAETRLPFEKRLTFDVRVPVSSRLRLLFAAQIYFRPVMAFFFFFPLPPNKPALGAFVPMQL